VVATAREGCSPSAPIAGGEGDGTEPQPPGQCLVGDGCCFRAGFAHRRDRVLCPLRLLSFLALREFVTIAPTSRGDHQALFWAFFLVTPAQYVLIAIKWYGMFTIMIPVYAFLFITIRIVLAAETTRFLERAAAIQWALMTCVYCLSYAPRSWGSSCAASPGREPNCCFPRHNRPAQRRGTVRFREALRRRRISPNVSPNKTWEGFLGGVALATLSGALIWWATPFNPWQAGVMALIVALMGFGGGLVMSAIKRDRG